MLHITARQLQAFTAVARHGNLSAAASELSLTKGAISQALQQLETQLRTPLFDRIHPGLRINSEGRQLQPLAEEALSRLQDIEHLFAPESEVYGALRIGCSQTIGNYLLPGLLARLRTQTAIQPRVQITNTHNLCEMLADFDLDLALIEGRSHHPELITTHWQQDEMWLVAPPDHPLAQQPEVALESLSGETFVVREPLSGSREQFDQRLFPHLDPCGELIEFNTLEAIITGVEQGLGLTLISKLAVCEAVRLGKLARLNIPLSFKRELDLVWHRDKHLSRGMQKFIELCGDYSID